MPGQPVRVTQAQGPDFLVRALDGNEWIVVGNALDWVREAANPEARPHDNTTTTNGRDLVISARDLQHFHLILAADQELAARESKWRPIVARREYHRAGERLEAVR